VHILLTDILTCPRCGPEFGLILLAERMVERRVLEGALGCSNCREKYPIRGGAVHFAEPHAGGPAGTETRAVQDDAAAAIDAAAAGTDADDALRLAALMGVTHGPAYVLIAGPAVVRAARVGSLVEGLEVITATMADAADVVPTPAPPGAGVAAVSRLVIAARLPLASARLAAVALTGAAADSLLEEGARVLGPLGRLVLEPAPSDATVRLTAAGLRVLAQEAGTIVAVDRRIGAMS
jgi:uncharacterized protein YbaR (Trm112 family)